MKKLSRIFQGMRLALMCGAAIITAGCVDMGDDDSGADTVVKVIRDTIVLPEGAPQAGFTDPTALPVTLPVLNAFFADSSFAGDLKARLVLTDAQIDSLRMIARQSVSGLRDDYSGEYMGTTDSALRHAEERINAIIGPQKGLQLAGLIRDRWGGGLAGGADSARVGLAGDSTSMGKLNAIPSDTRIVVNAPAYRMDVFSDGQLVKSYKVAIGYPEFPLPSGIRSARSVIFNPTWTPPDEPWVESSGKVKVGETVAAGSSKNPLGIAKIPIGLPSLIHGGKSQGQLGRFGSHGCVGLTNEQMRNFAPLLAGLAGTNISDSAIKSYERNSKETKDVMLGTPIPVELRYETIVVQDGKLYLYRDIYDRNTTTQETLQRVLGAYGVSIDQLTAEERKKVDDGLARMSRDARGRSDSAAASAPDTARGSKTITRSVKGGSEVVIEIAALRGKGYPAPEYSGKAVLAGGF